MKALVCAAALTLCACATLPATIRAPMPAKSVDIARLYSGTWHEIGRLPMAITDGCVAGTTAYAAKANGDIAVVDDCRVGSADGGRKVIAGTGHIEDAGTNAKLRVRYRLFGFVPLTWNFWILDRAEDYSWFISADPTFTRLFIFTRTLPSPSDRDRLVERARALGYDVSRLEFPAQPRD